MLLKSLFVVFFIMGTKAYLDKAEKIRLLEEELAEDLKAKVLLELNKLKECGQKFPKKEAYDLLAKISMKEVSKLRKKIIQLANLLVDPKDCKAARNITIKLKTSGDVKKAFSAIILHEEKEIGARAARVATRGLNVAATLTEDYINKALAGGAE